MNAAVIVAGGSSQRMGFDKLLAKVRGRSVLEHSVLAFADSSYVDDIWVVAKENRIGEFQKLIGSVDKVRGVVAGGAERHLSVWNGLQVIAEGVECVAVHDAARPLVSAAAIEKCFREAKDHGAACCAARVPDTLMRGDAENFVADSINRDGVWAMQTPQCFDFETLVSAYRHVIDKGCLVTDEASAVRQIGHSVKLVETSRWNIKITFPEDIEIAERFLANKK